MTRKIWFVTIILALTLLCACQVESNREINANVDIGTYSLHLRCIGQGSPTVVIDTGIGDTAERWRDFQSQVAEFTHVCIYDRAGYGASDPGPFPRHSQRMADELQQLLKHAGLRGPYVLVGHSLGGLNAQVFADRYPGSVSGLILLDPTPLLFITGSVFPELYQMLAEQAVEFQNMAEAARQSTAPEAQAQADYLEAIASEHTELINETAAQVATIVSFGDLPLIVIGSDLPNPGFGPQAEDFQQFWVDQNRELASKSAHGRFVLAEGSSHYIHEDAPFVVLAAIREMVEGKE